jgi:hypothetical protein
LSEFCEIALCPKSPGYYQAASSLVASVEYKPSNKLNAAPEQIIIAAVTPAVGYDPVMNKNCSRIEKL